MSANFDGSSLMTPTDGTTGADLSSIDNSSFFSSWAAPSSAPIGTDSSAWSGLDTLGSSVGNVGSSLLSSFGNLVSAQLNQTALLTSTGKAGVSLTAAQQASANAWRNYLMIAFLLAGVGVAIYVWKKK